MRSGDFPEFSLIEEVYCNEEEVQKDDGLDQVHSPFLIGLGNTQYCKHCQGYEAEAELY